MGAFDRFSQSYMDLCNQLKGIGEFPSEEALRRLKDYIATCGRRICIGTGRSGENAEVFVKFLRNLGYREVYGPEDIPYVFTSEDLIMAFSGSGTTTYTLETARVAKEAGAKVVSLTSNPSSPLGAISDLILYIPGKTEMGHDEDYHGRQLLGLSYSPLTPLGTLYELRTLFTELSLIDSMIVGTDVKACYTELCKLSREYVPRSEDFKRLYEVLPKPRSAQNPLAGKTVVIGEGLSGVVGKFFVTRLRHCARKDEERECYFFKDKGSLYVNENDLTLVISGSGENIPYRLAKRAKVKDVKVTAVTSYPDSSLAKMADVSIIIPGREIQRVKGLRSSYVPKDPRKSIFELRVLLSLEAFIYTIAQTEGITEKEMRGKHSDFI
jgi:6-phospho-3-hexuloisomerase